MSAKIFTQHAKHYFVQVFRVSTVFACNKIECAVGVGDYRASTLHAGVYGFDPQLSHTKDFCLVLGIRSGSPGVSIV